MYFLQSGTRTVVHAYRTELCVRLNLARIDQKGKSLLPAKAKSNRGFNFLDAMA
jgi:hypothetical protein